jgi:hypothetical protein
MTVRGNARFQCRQCHNTYAEPRLKVLGGTYLPIEKAELILKLLLEGNRVSSVARFLDVPSATIFKLLVLAGDKCDGIMGQYIRNVKVRDVELHEAWSFIRKKQKRVRPTEDPNYGYAYTFVAIERHTKLVLNIAMAKRDQATTDIAAAGWWAAPQSPAADCRAESTCARRRALRCRRGGACRIAARRCFPAARPTPVLPFPPAPRAAAMRPAGAGAGIPAAVQIVSRLACRRRPLDRADDERLRRSGRGSPATPQHF